MAAPTERTEHCFKRSIRYLAAYSGNILLLLRSTAEDPLRIWTEHRWVGDVADLSRMLKGIHEGNGVTNANRDLFGGEPEHNSQCGYMHM